MALDPIASLGRRPGTPGPPLCPLDVAISVVADLRRAGSPPPPTTPADHAPLAALLGAARPRLLALTDGELGPVAEAAWEGWAAGVVVGMDVTETAGCAGSMAASANRLRARPRRRPEAEVVAAADRAVALWAQVCVLAAELARSCGLVAAPPPALRRQG